MAAVVQPVGLRQRAVALLELSPGYAFAAFIHLFVIVIFSFWTVVEVLQEERKPVEVRLVAQNDVVLAPPAEKSQHLDTLPPPDELVTAVEADTNDPFQEAMGDTVGHMTRASRGFGLGASGGAGRGGNRSSRGGASSASEGALKGGLDWLARHRNKEGVWDAQGHGTRGPGEIGHTGLALLCFLFANHSPDEEGPYRDLVKRAIVWLTERVRADGVVGPSYQGYLQGIGTLALAEALARERTPELERAVARAVKCIEDAQNPQGGWRYRPREVADTSVTTWVALSLKSAEHAGVSVKPETWTTLKVFLDGVSHPDGTTGYMTHGSGSVAMGASGLFTRLMLGEAPTTPRNRKAAALMRQVSESLRPAGGDWDFYGMYYAALAMYQVGGEPWREFNPRVRDNLVARQTGGTGCERGAWRGAGMTSGHVLGTAFALLTLETYYRYLPVHEGGGDTEVLVRADASDLTGGERLLSEATWALEQATNHDDRGLLLAAEAGFETALQALEAEKGEKNGALQAEARARLVQVAALGSDGDGALRRAEEYLAKLPSDVRAHPAVLRVRRVELVRRAIEAARAATEPTATAAVVQGADEALRAAESALREEEAALTRVHSPDHAREVGDAATSIERLRLRLGVALAPDRTIDDVQAKLSAAPGPTPASAEERVVLEAAAERAIRELVGVAKGQRPATALEKADADLAWVVRRAPPGRLPDPVAARLGRTLEHAAITRLHALFALERDVDVLRSIADLRGRLAPDHDGLPTVDALERAALSRRVEGGGSSAAERERLVELLVAWARSAPDADGTTPWVQVGDLLLARGAVEDAERCYERALAAPDVDLATATSARLSRARIARARGDVARAEALLTELEQGPPEVRDRADVKLERCALLRALRRPREALPGYTAVLRSLEELRPPAWWEAAIGTAETYHEMGDVKEARRFLDGLRRRDPTFGGDEERKRRIIDLIVKLDAAR